MKNLLFIFNFLLLLSSIDGISAILYSITDGDWETNGTWSTTGHGGSSCGCTPGSNDDVIVGGGDAVTFSSDVNLDGGGNPNSLTN